MNKELMEQVATLKRQSEINLEGIHPHVRPGHEVAKREAQDKLKELRPALESMVRRGVGLVLESSVTPKDVDSLLVKRHGMVKLDAQKLYVLIADEIWPSIQAAKSKVFDSDQVTLLLFGLNEVAKVYDLDVKHPDLVDNPMLPTIHDLRAFVRKVIRATNGDALNFTFLKRQAIDMIVEARRSEEPLMFVLSGTTSEDESAALGSLFNRYHQTVKIAPNTKYTEKSVAKMYEDFKGAVKAAGQQIGTETETQA